MARAPRYVPPHIAAEWEELAACRNRDQGPFYPDHANESPARAKAICRSCEVRTQCLEVALLNDERYGIWGGMTEGERRRLKRRTGT